MGGKAVYRGAWDAFNEKGSSLETIYGLLGASLLSGKFDSAYKSVDNKILRLSFPQRQKISRRRWLPSTSDTFRDVS